MRLAMWSGPRNLSTAMMYAFGARKDMAVVDEPFYAAYLAETGLDHPMRKDILASQLHDPSRVIADLLGPVPNAKQHFYQKHMSQHMIDAVPRDWLHDVTNVFLIRHPARVVASFAAKYENPTLLDLGFQQQADLFDLVAARGATPVVIDSHDIRAQPEHMLRQLCRTVGLNWDSSMLSWPVGGHKDDGVWASHWYGAVHRSTGFAKAESALPNLSGQAAELSEKALPYYEKLSKYKIL